MMRKVNVRPCVSCGQEVRPSAWRKGKRRCVSCGLARALIANTEQRAKYGEAHNAWVASMARAVSRETSRLSQAADDTEAINPADTQS